MYKNVIFDLDGTLLNTLEDLAAAVNWVCAQHGWPAHGVEEYKYFVGNGAPKLLERVVPPEVEITEELRRVTLEEFTQRYNAHKEDKTTAYPGMPEAVRQLREAGLTLAVLSNKPHDAAFPVVERYYPGVFHAVQGALPGVPVKPDPTLLRRGSWGRRRMTPSSWGTAVWISAPRKMGALPAAVCCGASGPGGSWRRRGRTSSRRPPGNWWS